MRVNLIPMAGAGMRYVKKGYKTPKPLIEIQGMPMVVRAARALPKADRWIFVCRREHLASIENVLKKYFDAPVIVSIDKLTEGQALTCMLARDHIPNDATLTIGPSDNDMIYSEGELEKYFNNNQLDAWVWTFRHNSVVLQDPRMYGWVRLNLEKQIDSISCKQPVSSNPLEDHAIIGAFTFRKAKIFFEAVEKMLEQNQRINNEYYVDTSINMALESGYKVHVFEVENYIGWGTPQDLEIYRYWQKYFRVRNV